MRSLTLCCTWPATCLHPSHLAILELGSWIVARSLVSCDRSCDSCIVCFGFVGSSPMLISSLVLYCMMSPLCGFIFCSIYSLFNFSWFHTVAHFGSYCFTLFLLELSDSSSKHRRCQWWNPLKFPQRFWNRSAIGALPQSNSHGTFRLQWIGLRGKFTGAPNFFLGEHGVLFSTRCSLKPSHGLGYGAQLWLYNKPLKNQCNCTIQKFDEP